MIDDFVQQVARYGSVIPYCSVHLDARMISPRYGMKCGDFLTCFFVQQVARYGKIPPRCVIDDFVLRGDSPVFTILKRCMLIIVSYDELC